MLFRLQKKGCRAYDLRVASRRVSTSGWGIAAAIIALLGTCTFSFAQSADALIRQLGDHDSQRRVEAETKLLGMGVSARPALIPACRSDDPAIASAAARVLLMLPWSRPSDPPEVVQILAEYGKQDDPQRIGMVGRIAQMEKGAGNPALLRLVVEDPSEDVCWKIVTCLNNTDDPAVPEKLRQLNADPNRPAALVAMARAWLLNDPGKAMDLFNQALQTELRHPSYDDNELDVAFDQLCTVAIANHDYSRAAELRRAQASRIGVSASEYPLPVYQLFLLHGQYGPLAGFDNDVAMYSQFIGHPQIMYALSQAYSRAGRDLEAAACQQAAYASTFTPTLRILTGNFLYVSHWADLARREMYAILDCNEPAIVSYRMNVLHMLAVMSSFDDNDADAITHFKSMAAIADERQLRLRVGPNNRVEDPTEYEAEIAWRTARIAAAKKDQAELRTQLDKLMQLASTNTDVVQNTYPLLIAAGRRQDAKALFDEAYARFKVQIDAGKVDPVSWNDLAWLCARCDQKLDEALEYSRRAIAAQPYEAAFLDTMAEVHFRRGEMKEAVEFESRAAQLEPGDVFMNKQLNRFKAAAAAKN